MPYPVSSPWSSAATPLAVRIASAAALLGIWLAPGLVVAGTPDHPQSGIYTCVDSQGRRLTADRPIVACIDREQRELNPSGTVRRLVGPTLTERERAAAEDSARREAAEQARAQEQMRRERALLLRYPDQQAFDTDRRAALRQSDDSVAFARQRIAELERRQEELRKSASQFTSRAVAVPYGLQQDAADNVQALNFQQNIVAEQQRDRQRIIERYDAEQIRLRRLWADEAAAGAPAAAWGSSTER